MALKLKYTDEHGILHINMSPSSTPRTENRDTDDKTDLTDPKFDTINNRFGQYDLFGGKYEVGGEPETRSLFRSRYNSIEEELANTPYAFATERSLRLNSASPVVDITIKALDASPSKDIEDDRFFNRNIEYDGLFGPQIDFQTSVKSDDESPAFTVTQLIHAQDRYYNLSSRQSGYESPKVDSVTEVRSKVRSAGAGRTVTVGVKSDKDEAFKVISAEVKETETPAGKQVVPTAKRKESSFAILAEASVTSRSSSPKSLPADIRRARTSPRVGFSSRHNTPKTSAANSRANSPPRRRTNSLSRIDNMATATLPPPIPSMHNLSRPHSPRNFVKENIEEVRELSELNREIHEAEAEKKRREEEEALLQEMAMFDKSNNAIRSVVCSRTTSRSNSPNKLKLRSRSNSPAAVSPSAILHYENIPVDKREYINEDDGMADPVTHNSRLRTTSRSQPHSNDGSPKHSKIPKRQNSVSPSRTNSRNGSSSRKHVENNLTKNQRFISNSTSSIHETIRIGSQNNDRRAMSKSTQLLNIAPANIKGKPPISPGRGGPPPSNKSINAKRLSPIVGTPNKSPIEDLKPGSARTMTKTSPVARKSVKTAGNTPATSRLNSRQPSRTVSRDTSPEKRRNASKPATTSKSVNNIAKSKPVVRAASTRTTQKPTVSMKTDPKKPINRTNSMKTLSRTPSTKTLYEKPSLLKKRDSKQDLKAQSMSKINEAGAKKDNVKDDRKSPIKTDKSKELISKGSAKAGKEKLKAEQNKMSESGSGEEITTQDNETQYDKITNEKGELIILTKKNIVSMTTAAITAQPLEIVTTVTNQLPAAFEKAREKGIFERHSSKDSLAPKDEDRDTKSEAKETKGDAKEMKDVKETPKEKEEVEDKKVTKANKPDSNKTSVFGEDNVKFKPLLPPYNNPQVERAKQRIDDILKSPEVSTENIATPPAKIKDVKETKPTMTFKSIADKTKNDIKDAKDVVATKLTNLKDQVVKQNEKNTDEIRSEVTKIVDSIITPVEEPKEILERPKEDLKTEIEPIVMVVNEKKNDPIKSDIVEKMTETLVKGEAEVEVQSSNMSTPPGMDKMAVQSKMAEGSESEKSQSNGGFPQSTSTTPKPPARAHRKDQSNDDSKTSTNDTKETTPDSQSTKKPNICQRLIGKCKKCCPCCVKAEDDEKETKEVEAPVEGKRGAMSRLNCCKKNKEEEEMVRDIERAAGKAASLSYESETKRKRKFRDVMCGCCGSRRRVSDVSDMAVRDVTSPGVVRDTGCCGRGRAEVERRDSILSDRPPNSCCNNRLFTWIRGSCRRQQPEQESASRRQSLFSKNKSLSPTLPPEDTRTKLDASLVEHTSVMRGAIPVLPPVLAYFCLFCNVIVPGLGTIFSGMFCLCFGIPRFGVHDSALHRIGSFFINLLVGCGQLFTVLFCLVGWGWSIWWGVIMIRIARKYRKLKAEEAAEEAEAAPPVTANNHTRA